MTHPYRSTPMEHQVTALRLAWRKAEFALFHEMGTGKTFTTINLAAARYLKGQIDSLVVICPTPIKLVWEDEIDKWIPEEIDYAVHVHTSGKKPKEDLIYFTQPAPDHFKIVVIGVESLSQGNTWQLVENYVKLNRTMVVCDESSRLKSPKADRTKRAITIASHCLYRLILTGTPITQGIEDLFSQFQFLNPKIIGMRSFFQFRNMYCVSGGFQGKKVIGYQNTDQLMKKVAPYVHTVKKEEVLDLPPKMYEKIYVDPTSYQLKAIKELVDEQYTEQEDKWLLTETQLEAMTRFQQIIGGHFPYDEEGGGHGVEPIQGTNPKLDALLDLVQDIPLNTKVIIWARFQPEIELIRNCLSEKGYPVVTFYGKNTDEERKSAVKEFQEGQARFIVSNPLVGGMGQTWTAATVVIYYSNSFSLENRLQSEDRAHRKGQEHAVTYFDIEANHKYDRMILKAISRKQSVAEEVDRRIAMYQEINDGPAQPD